jgi:hypothetical protein
LSFVSFDQKMLFFLVAVENNVCLEKNWGEWIGLSDNGKDKRKEGSRGFACNLKAGVIP